jgi:hypothetical protein
MIVNPGMAGWLPLIFFYTFFWCVVLAILGAIAGGLGGKRGDLLQGMFIGLSIGVLFVICSGLPLGLYREPITNIFLSLGVGAVPCGAAGCIGAYVGRRTQKRKATCRR